MLEYEVRKKERQHSGGRRPASCTLGQTPTPLRQMLREMKKASQEVKPSKYWVELNRKNIEQLERMGYENFKQTLALNYFTFIVPRGDSQVAFLESNLPRGSVIKAALRTAWLKLHPFFTYRQSIDYNYLTYLLWEYAEATTKLLKGLDEPREGNPPELHLGGKLISQDLANAALEFWSIASRVEMSSINSVLELGGGYGRTAYVFLKLMPQVKYIMVDIPPALYVAERYLPSVLPDRTVFRYRPFKDYGEVKQDFENAEIAFLLPSQLELLPDDSADLSINISSLHEMKPEQIRYYLKEISRLTKLYFYMKEWKVSKIPFENVIVKEEDYAIPEGWQQLYWRTCKVQTLFFEALFKTIKNQAKE